MRAAASPIHPSALSRDTSRDAASRRPRKIPQQSRSRETFTAILEAARVILRREGSVALTMPRLATVAGVSVGSLYQYFGNRNAVLQSLLDEHIDELQQFLVREVEAALAESMAVDVVGRRVLAAMRKLLAQDAVVLTVVLCEGVEGTRGSTLFEAMRDQVEITVRFALEARRSRLVVKNLDMAAVLVTRVCLAATYGVMMGTPELLDDPNLLEESVDMLRRYLEG